MPQTAQDQLDMRALEIAKETQAELRGHMREDEIHFGNLREDMGQLHTRMDADKRDIIGAINTLRTDESDKRKEIYKTWDRYRDKAIWVLGAALVALGLYIWRMKVGG